MEWEIEFVSEYGSTLMRHIDESKVPKYVDDRAYDGEFGIWLRHPLIKT